MEEAEARKARLAAIRARAGAGAGVGGGPAAPGGLVTPQMLGAPPAGLNPAAMPARPPAPAPMASTGFYTAMHTPGVNTPVIEAFSMGDRPQAAPQRPPFGGQPGQPPPFNPHQPMGHMMMGGMGGRGRGGWQGPAGRGGPMGGMPGMQGPGPHRGDFYPGCPPSG